MIIHRVVKQTYYPDSNSSSIFARDIEYDECPMFSKKEDAERKQKELFKAINIEPRQAKSYWTDKVKGTSFSEVIQEGDKITIKWWTREKSEDKPYEDKIHQVDIYIEEVEIG